MNKLCALAAAAALFPGIALAQVFPGVDDDKVHFSGSVTGWLGFQDVNPESIYPPGSQSQPALVDAKLNAVLSVRKPGSFLGVFDGQVDRQPYATDSNQNRLNQLYGLFDLSDTWKLRVGKQRVLWGHGFAYIPTDFINPPLDPTGIDLVKEGVVGVSFDYIRESYAVTGLATRYDAVTGTKAGMGFGLKFATSAWSGVDLDVIYYYTDAVGHAGGISFAADPSQLGFPWSTGLILTGSLAVNQKSRYPQVVTTTQPTPAGPVSFPAVGPTGVDGPYVSYLAGVAYDVPKWRLRAAAEYYSIGDAYTESGYDSILSALSNPASLQAQLASPWLNRLAYGRNQRQYLTMTIGQSSITERGSRFSDTLGYEFGLLRGLDDYSNQVSLSVISNYWNHVAVTVSAYVPIGQPVTEFGTTPYDWYLQMQVKVGF